MNIFILDYDIVACAHYMVDDHIVKMPTEHVQMMNAVCDIHGLPTNMKFWKSVYTHPCTLWLAESIYNWQYLYNLTIAMHDEWRDRWNHWLPDDTHASYDKMLQLQWPALPHNVGLTPFAQVLGPRARLYRQRDPVQAYRAYYIGEKQHLAKWKHNEIPHWWEKK